MISEILLFGLFVAVIYAIFVLERRIKQVNDVRQEMAERQKKRVEEEIEFDNRAMSLLTIPPPKEPNPRVAELERQIDALYDAERRVLRGEKENKEKELIGKIVDIFIMEADKKVLHESVKSNESGSK